VLRIDAANLIFHSKGIAMNLPVPSFVKKIARAVGLRRPRGVDPKSPPPPENAQYWADVNVTSHARFASAADSLAAFHDRNSLYYPYLDLMPVAGQDGKAVLDYGCGPGTDLVGFAVYSKPRRLIGMDISLRSLAEARERLALHCERVEFSPIVEGDGRLPLEDGSIDYVHSSGVIHHAVDPAKVLREFRRILSRSGRCRIMVYNYDSVWLHLAVAYLNMHVAKIYADLDVRAAFSKLTDGADCPIARVYKPNEFISLAQACGFECRFLGAAVSMTEAGFMPRRFDALSDFAFPREHRDFLSALTLDSRGLPLYHDTYAGVDACYELTPV